MYTFAKVATFRQIWSHCRRRRFLTVLRLLTNENIGMPSSQRIQKTISKLGLEPSDQPYNCSMIVNYYASIVGTDWKIAQSTTLKS